MINKNKGLKTSVCIVHLYVSQWIVTEINELFFNILIMYDCTSAKTQYNWWSKKNINFAEKQTDHLVAKHQ